MLKEELEVSNGKLDKTSQKFRKLFLLRFALELIKSSKVEDFFLLENIIKKRDKKARSEERNLEKKYGKGELIPSIMHREPFRRKPESEARPIFAQSGVQKSSWQQPTIKKTPSQSQMMSRTPVQIPEYPLPQRLQYLRPIPSNVQIDLGKLNQLIQDQNIKTIECNGPDENITVKGNAGSKTTNIILSKSEMDEVLQRFSEASKIPIHEGIFKIVVGRLVLSAIVSEVVGSKFIIKKMSPQAFSPMQMQMTTSTVPTQPTVTVMSEGRRF